MKCCVCKKEIIGHGNNPFPIAGKKCCDDCNINVVVPLRIFFNSIDKKNCALLIKEKTIEIIKPKSKYFTLKELKQCIGGHIQIISSSLPEYLVACDEDGLLKSLYWNDLAHLTFGHELVGNILICPVKIFDKPEED